MCPDLCEKVGVFICICIKHKEIIMENNESNRDNIDFGQMSIPRLFVKLFIPTLMGLIFLSILNIADGVFVGKGVGSDALAAVNIAGPVYLISSGVGLMFAAGVSVVAAIHLSRGNIKAANINVTQALVVPTLLMSLLMSAILLFPDRLCMIFGGSERLMPLVVDYLVWISPVPMLSVIVYVGSFVMRLDGSPKVAMWINIIVSLLNIFLDWLMVFPLAWGIKGAAIATMLSMMAGGLMALAYLLFFSNTIKLYRLKFTRTSMRLTVRNLGYMMRLGMPTFIAEGAIACMMIVGNYMFISRLHEDGVAAFSVACYLFPVVFMFGNAAAQSQLPIISYNYGLGDRFRVSRTFSLSVGVGTGLGLLVTVVSIGCCHELMSLFLDSGTPPYDIAVAGFPYFTASFLFFTLNLIIIGFLQSIERAKTSIFFMLLRGFVFVVPCFVFLPSILGDRGLWLAVPLSEFLTFGCMAAYFLLRRNEVYC